MPCAASCLAPRVLIPTTSSTPHCLKYFSSLFLTLFLHQPRFTTWTFTSLFQHIFCLHRSFCTCFSTLCSLPSFFDSFPIMSSSKKKKHSREDSASFEAPLSPDLDASQAHNSQEDSDVSLLAPHPSWMNGNKKPATSTPGLNTHNSNDAHAEPLMETPGNIRSNIRDASYDIKDAGTGHHDNRLSKLPPGQFREPSLRRGYGMPYQAPKAFDSMQAKDTSQVGNSHAQALDSLPETQTQPSNSAPHQSLATSQRLLPTLNKDGRNVVSINIYRLAWMYADNSSLI